MTFAQRGSWRISLIWTEPDKWVILFNALSHCTGTSTRQHIHFTVQILLSLSHWGSSDGDRSISGGFNVICSSECFTVFLFHCSLLQALFYRLWLLEGILTTSHSDILSLSLIHVSTITLNLLFAFFLHKAYTWSNSYLFVSLFPVLSNPKLANGPILGLVLLQVSFSIGLIPFHCCLCATQDRDCTKTKICLLVFLNK